MQQVNPRILVVDDDESVVAMIKLLLEQELSAEVTVAYTCAAAREAMKSVDFDLVTLDYQMPDESGLELLKEITSSEEHPPVIMVTGYGDEQTAVESFKEGASGYVVKDRRLTTLLVEESERAIQFRRAIEALKRSEAQLKLITENMGDSVTQSDRTGQFIYHKPSREVPLGYTSEEMTGRTSTELMHPDDRKRIAEQFRQAVRNREQLVRLEYRYKRKDGEYIWVESNTRLLYDDEGRHAGAIFGSRDVTERKRVEELIRAQRDIALALSEESEPDRVYELALENILELTGLDAGSVHILDRPTGELDIAYHTGLSEKFVGAVTHNERTDLLAKMVTAGEPVFHDYQEVVSDRSAALENEGIRSFAVVPLRFEGEVVGSLNVASHNLEAFTPAMRDTVESIANLVGQAVGRSRLLGALRESEERYRMLYEEMGEPTYTYDLELNLIGINRRACELIGYEREELMGRNVLALGILHPDDMEAAGRDIQMLFTGEEEVVHDEYRFILKDGSQKLGDVTGAALRSEVGKIIGVTNVVIDITEKKAAQDALKRSEEQHRQAEERYRALFDQSPIGVLIFNDDLVVTECNDRFIEMFETARERMMGRELADIGEHAIIPFLREALEGRVAHYEGPFHDEPTGMSLWISAEISPLRDAQGVVVGGIGAVEDITERKKAEDELLRANEELRGYAQTVSHDLKGPIAAMQVAAETFINAARAGSSSEELAEVLDVIRHNSDRASKRIEDLLRLAEAGQAPVAVEDVDAGAVVKDVLADMSVMITETCAKVFIDDDLGRLRANWTQVYQVFSNLISNALAHNDSDRPTVEVRYLGEDDAGAHRYQVCDNGPGIPPSEIKDIFKPFYKGGNTEGTGIGLSIAERIVRAYDGELTVYNDGGACFEFTLHDAL